MDEKVYSKVILGGVTTPLGAKAENVSVESEALAATDVAAALEELAGGQVSITAGDHIKVEEGKVSAVADTEVSDNSANLVTSGAVAAAIAAAVVADTAVTKDSTNLVTSGAVYSDVNALSESIDAKDRQDRRDRVERRGEHRQHGGEHALRRDRLHIADDYRFCPRATAADEYLLDLRTGDSVSVTLPSVVWAGDDEPDWTANTGYQVSIVNGVAAYLTYEL